MVPGFAIGFDPPPFPHASTQTITAAKNTSIRKARNQVRRLGKKNRMMQPARMLNFAFHVPLDPLTPATAWLLAAVELIPRPVVALVVFDVSVTLAPGEHAGGSTAPAGLDVNSGDSGGNDVENSISRHVADRHRPGPESKNFRLKRPIPVSEEQLGLRAAGDENIQQAVSVEVAGQDRIRRINTPPQNLAQ